MSNSIKKTRKNNAKIKVNREITAHVSSVDPFRVHILVEFILSPKFTKRADIIKAIIVSPGIEERFWSIFQCSTWMDDGIHIFFKSRPMASEKIDNFVQRVTGLVIALPNEVKSIEDKLPSLNDYSKKFEF